MFAGATTATTFVSTTVVSYPYYVTGDDERRRRLDQLYRDGWVTNATGYYEAEVPYVSRAARRLALRAAEEIARLRVELEAWRQALARAVVWRECPRVDESIRATRASAARARPQSPPVERELRHVVHRMRAASPGRWLAGSGRRPCGRRRPRSPLSRRRRRRLRGTPS